MTRLVRSEIMSTGLDPAEVTATSPSPGVVRETVEGRSARDAGHDSMTRVRDHADDVRPAGGDKNLSRPRAVRGPVRTASMESKEIARHPGVVEET